MQTKKTRQKLIIIVGPTSSGKSELAIKLARHFNGEIISADSRQVYRGLDIGTGKIEGVWCPVHTVEGQKPIQSKVYVYKKIPHYCIDFVDPKKQFSVAEFKQCAEDALRDIATRGKMPILVGGTNFWVNAVVYDLDFPEVPPNEPLRKKLEQKTSEELLLMLKKLDPKRARTIEQKNSRRLIRAIEIAQALGKVPEIKKRHPYDTLWMGISVQKETLEKKIAKRLAERIDSGMIDEAKTLRKKGLSWKRFYQFGLEYPHLADFLRKKLTKKDMEAQMLKANIDYARRQMVWLKKNPAIQWVTTAAEIISLTATFLADRI